MDNNGNKSTRCTLVNYFYWVLLRLKTHSVTPNIRLQRADLFQDLWQQSLSFHQHSFIKSSFSCIFYSLQVELGVDSYIQHAEIQPYCIFVLVAKEFTTKVKLLKLKIAKLMIVILPFVMKLLRSPSVTGYRHQSSWHDVDTYLVGPVFRIGLLLVVKWVWNAEVIHTISNKFKFSKRNHLPRKTNRDAEFLDVCDHFQQI